MIYPGVCVYTHARMSVRVCVCIEKVKLPFKKFQVLDTYEIIIPELTWAHKHCQCQCRLKLYTCFRQSSPTWFSQGSGFTECKPSSFLANLCTGPTDQKLWPSRTQALPVHILVFPLAPEDGVAWKLEEDDKKENPGER